MSKNEEGLTLIELLAALSIVSIVLLLASSVQIFGQKQVNTQTSDFQKQTDVRLAINILTKEIRKASDVSIKGPVMNGIVSSTELMINGTDLYKVQNNLLTKNGQA